MGLGLTTMPSYASIFAGILAGVMVMYALFGVLLYVVVAVTFFMLFRKAQIKLAWLAFIPIAQLWPFFWTIKKSAWNVLWVFVPTVVALLSVQLHQQLGVLLFVLGSVLPVVLGVIWQVRLFKAFHMNPWWLLIMVGFVIPILSLAFELVYLILLLYMAFSKKVQYDPFFDGKGGPGGDPDSQFYT